METSNVTLRRLKTFLKSLENKFALKNHSHLSDSELSATSMNPVQNKVITQALQQKADKSETTVNLIIPTLQTETHDGVTCTNNGDGTYTVKGTNTNVQQYSFLIGHATIINKDRYKLIGSPPNKTSNTTHMWLGNADWSIAKNDVNDDGTIILPSDIYEIFINVRGNETVNDTFKPMLTTNLNATLDDFVPYTGNTGSINGDVADVRKKITDLKKSVNGDVADVRKKIADLKKSVSDGKTSVANAITAKGVSTATDAEFSTMATNISQIKTGGNVTINGSEVTSDLNLKLYSYMEIEDSHFRAPVPYESGTMIVHNNEIHLLSPSGYSGYHYVYNGSQWTRVGTDAPFFKSVVVYNNEIHGFTTDVHYKFNGTSWSIIENLPMTISEYTGTITYNNVLYLFSYVNHKNIAYKYDGTSWTSITAFPYTSNTDRVPVIYNNECHILMTGKHYKFDGTNYTSIPGVPTAVRRQLVTVYDNKIHIVYGSFEYTYNGSSWIRDGMLMTNSDSASIVVYKNDLHIFGGHESPFRHSILYIQMYIKER